MVWSNFEKTHTQLFEIVRKLLQTVRKVINKDMHRFLIVLHKISIQGVDRSMIDCFRKVVLRYHARYSIYAVLKRKGPFYTINTSIAYSSYVSGSSEIVSHWDMTIYILTLNKGH